MQIDGYNFTQRMQGTLWDAVAEAQALNHEYIGTEHLLLALLRGTDRCGAVVLGSLGADLAATANRVLTIVQRGTARHDPSCGSLLPLSSRAKKVLELAKDEAQALHHSSIGTEHLLLGMLAEGKGVAAQVLADAGVDLDLARSQVRTMLGTNSEDARRRAKEVPPREEPAFVRVVLEYMNGAVLSKQFTTTREATAFLEGRGRV